MANAISTAQILFRSDQHLPSGIHMHVHEICKVMLPVQYVNFFQRMHWQWTSLSNAPMTQAASYNESGNG